MKKPFSLQSLMSFLLTLELVQALSRYITIKDQQTNNTVHLFGSLHYDAITREQIGLSKEQATQSVLEESLAIKIITQKEFINAYFEVPHVCSTSLIVGTERLFCNEFERKGLKTLWDGKGFETAIGQQLLVSYPLQSNYDGTLRALTPAETDLILDYPVFGILAWKLLSPLTHFHILVFGMSSIAGGVATQKWASGKRLSAVGVGFFSAMSYIGIQQYLTLFGQKFSNAFNQEAILSNSFSLPKMQQLALSHVIESVDSGSTTNKALFGHRDKRFAASIEKILQTESSPQKPQSSTTDSTIDFIAHEVKKDSLIIFGAGHMPGIYALLSDNPNYEILEHDVHGMIQNDIAPYRNSKQKNSFNI